MLGRSLLMKASGAGRLLLYPAYVHEFLDRMTNADILAGNTLGLELAVTDAFSNCLQALVADGILGVSGGALSQSASLIKAGCLMMGARTLSGALVPLAADMPAPTNFNWVAGDYNRRTGLGDPANVSKYLSTNRAANADPTNSRHLAVWISTHHTRNTTRADIGDATTGPTSGDSQLLTTSTTRFYRCNTIDDATVTETATATGLWGASRNSATQSVGRYNSTNTTFNSNSGTNDSSVFTVFSRGATSFSNARLAFYTVGTFLDLAILDARITALSNAIQAAIAP